MNKKLQPHEYSIARKEAMEELYGENWIENLGLAEKKKPILLKQKTIGGYLK